MLFFPFQCIHYMFWGFSRIFCSQINYIKKILITCTSFVKLSHTGLNASISSCRKPFPSFQSLFKSFFEFVQSFRSYMSQRRLECWLDKLTNWKSVTYPINLINHNHKSTKTLKGKKYKAVKPSSVGNDHSWFNHHQIFTSFSFNKHQFIYVYEKRIRFKTVVAQEPG